MAQNIYPEQLLRLQEEQKKAIKDTTDQIDQWYELSITLMHFFPLLFFLMSEVRITLIRIIMTFHLFKEVLFKNKLHKLTFLIDFIYLCNFVLNS